MIKKQVEADASNEQTGPDVSKMIDKPTGDYYGYWGKENGDRGGNIFWPTDYETTTKRHWDKETQTLS